MEKTLLKGLARPPNSEKGQNNRLGKLLPGESIFAGIAELSLMLRFHSLPHSPEYCSLISPRMEMFSIGHGIGSKKAFQSRRERNGHKWSKNICRTRDRPFCTVVSGQFGFTKEENAQCQLIGQHQSLTVEHSPKWATRSGFILHLITGCNADNPHDHFSMSLLINTG